MSKQIITSILTSLVASLLIISAYFDLAPKSGGDLGGQYNNLNSTFNDGITFTKNVGYQGAVVNLFGGVIGAGQNQAYWLNDTGREAYVSIFVKPVATTTSSNTISPIASSTMQIVAGTSTAATIANYTAPSSLTTASLLYWKLATSTAAKTLTASSTESGFAPSTAPNRRVRVGPGEYLNIAILAQASVDTDQIGTPTATCGNLNCETATSTNRGFDLRYILSIWTPPNLY